MIHFSRFVRGTAVRAAGAAVLATFALTAPLGHGQEAPPALQAPAPTDAPQILEAPLPPVDPKFLEPIKALTGDREAFLDKLWAMGNAEMSRIGDLKVELAGMLQEHEAKQRRDEIAVRQANLEALCALAMQSFEQSASVRNFHGTVLYDIFGEELEGVKEWHTAVSLDSSYSDPYNNLGMYYFHAGEYRLGFQNMDKALELDPKNPDYCFNMAQNYLIYRPQTEEIRGWSADKVYKEAMKYSKKATKLAPEDYEILVDYAVNFLAAENFGLEPDWKEAIEAWRVARVKAPTDVDKFYTWLNEGRAWRSLDKVKEARKCFEEALALQPQNAKTKELIESLSAE